MKKSVTSPLHNSEVASNITLECLTSTEYANTERFASLFQKDLVFITQAYEMSVSNGNMETAKILHALGARLVARRDIAVMVIRSKNTEMLDWLRENDKPIPDKFRFISMEEMMEYIRMDDPEYFAEYSNQFDQQTLFEECIAHASCECLKTITGPYALKHDVLNSKVLGTLQGMGYDMYVFHRENIRRLITRFSISRDCGEFVDYVDQCVNLTLPERILVDSSPYAENDPKLGVSIVGYPMEFGDFVSLVVQCEKSAAHIFKYGDIRIFQRVLCMTECQYSICRLLADYCSINDAMTLTLNIIIDDCFIANEEGLEEELIYRMDLPIPEIEIQRAVDLLKSGFRPNNWKREKLNLEGVLDHILRDFEITRIDSTWQWMQYLGRSGFESWARYILKYVKEGATIEEDLYDNIYSSPARMAIARKCKHAINKERYDDIIQTIPKSQPALMRGFIQDHGRRYSLQTLEELTARGYEYALRPIMELENFNPLLTTSGRFRQLPATARFVLNPFGWMEPYPERIANMLRLLWWVCKELKIPWVIRRNIVLYLS